VEAERTARQDSRPTILDGGQGTDTPCPVYSGPPPPGRNEEERMMNFETYPEAVAPSPCPTPEQHMKRHSLHSLEPPDVGKGAAVTDRHYRRPSRPDASPSRETSKLTPHADQMLANAGQKMKSNVDLSFEETAVTDRRYRRPSRPDASPSRDESASICVSIRNLS